MADQNDNGGKTLGIKSGAGTVKQSFARGRSKQVVVETKRKRTVMVPGRGGDTAAQRGGVGNINSAEIERRRKAVEAAQAQESDRAAREKADNEKRDAELARLRAEKAAAVEKEAAERAERLAAEKAVPETAVKASVDPAAIPVPPKATQNRPSSTPSRPNKAPDRKEEERNAKPKNAGGDDRRRGKLTISQALGGDQARQRSAASLRRRQEREKRKAGGQDTGPREKVIRDVQIPDAITVQELANRMAERVAAVVKALMTNGIMATQNQTIDSDTATLIVEEFGHKVVRVSDAALEESVTQVEDKDEDLEPRSPIITIMGHVDHGKTSLLDAIRKTNVVSGEAGGITQHIGAYQITTDGGALLTFLDTPGHAAFTSMRSRGAQVTDIVVLVVAADDSVMPQTIEAIKHAKAADVPMIVAINKIDKEGADVNKVRAELLQHEVIVEAMSGDVLDVEVSALSGQGLDVLLENIALQAELLELKANPNRSAQGAVIEAKLDVGRGPVATVLVQTGTLRVGDIFVVGQQHGRVRALIDDQGEQVKEAGPSRPVEVLGLQGAPEAGDVLNVVENDAKAREIAEYRAQIAKDKRAAQGAATTLDQLLAKKKADEDVAELPVLVKADVQGSAEAITQALEKIGNDEVRVRVLHAGVGAITESDIGLAEASQAAMIGFNVRANAQAREAANQKGVEIRYYSIIYDLVDDIKAAASGLLSAEIKETFIGYASIKEVFKVTGVGKVAGCTVTEGVARRAAGVRLLRDDVVVHEGKLKTLKRFKDEVKEVNGGQECGMAFENYEDIRAGDVIEIFTSEEIERSL